MTLRIAMIGYAFMGRAHSQAWRNAHRFFDLPQTPEMRVLCGRDAAATEAAAQRLGWAEWATDWREVIARDDVDVVDICTPGSSHAPIALAALAAGKHVLCEKPLANTLDEAIDMTAAAEQAAERGVLSMVGFNYRRTPALAFARQLVEQGFVGTLRHIRAQYLQDWIVDPQFPLVWRLRREEAGSGLGFGLCCVGSSIGLMAMLVALDVMSLFWMSVVAVLALVQKLLPARAAIDIPVALALIGLGLVIVINPSLIPGLMPPAM